jgi:DNA modification methylase
MQTNIILQGDALTELKKLPSESISCVMTSPPYWALRDYGIDVETIWDAKEGCEHQFEIKEHYSPPQSDKHTCGKIEGLEKEWREGFCSKCGAWKGQLGLEPTFDLYIKHLCDIFDEAKRILRKDGTCWVNLGDTYNAHSTGQGNVGGMEKENKPLQDIQAGNNRKIDLPDKSLCLIPFRFAIEMQNRGWILRNVLIWHKPNCMPSSVKDRFTVDFEYLFFFVKSKKYWFETQYEPSQYDDREKRRKYGRHQGKDYPKGANAPSNCDDPTEYANRFIKDNRNKRAVWSICPRPFKEAHFATYPEELCETPIRAGCPEFICKKCGKAREKMFDRQIAPPEVFTNKNTPDESFTGSYVDGEMKGQGQKLQNWRDEHPDKFLGLTDCNCQAGFESGIVLDMFMGAGTTALVALKQNKRFIGIELQPKYIDIAMKRLKPYLEQTKLELSDGKI